MKNFASTRPSFVLSSLLASMALVGCGDNLEPGSGQPGGTGQPATPFPASCADAGNGAVLPDGDVTLYAGGDEARPWTAYCHDNDEYLPVTDPTTNFGEYAAGGQAVGTAVRTEYAKLRIDPQTFTIDISDQTFARTTGSLTVNGTVVTSMPLGVAAACDGLTTIGGAGIDLTGTPFVISTSWTQGGVVDDANSALFRDGQWFEAWAGGACAHIAPAAVQGLPVNQLADGWVLKVAYTTQPLQP